MFWKKVSKVNGERWESCSRIKNGNGRLALGEDELARVILRIFIIPKGRMQSTSVALMLFGGGNYFGGKLKWGTLGIERLQVRMRSLKR